MHKRTFKAIQTFPRVATVWGASPLRGRVGEIVSKNIENETLEISFPKAGTSAHVSFRDVALGDNSDALVEALK